MSRWGIWGGRKPGGWCMFRVAGVFPGAHVGTREEAEAGLDVFLIEMKKYGYSPSEFSYELVPFDPAKLPEADEKTVPSKVQADVLLALTGADYDAFNRLLSPGSSGTRPKRSTMDSLRDRGWLFGYVDVDPSRVIVRTTPAGERARSRYESRKNNRL